MPLVDLRWRPSGGRGEYEHVPQDVLLGRRIVVNAVSVPGAYIDTDAWGRIRDGKPRIRRDNPNDRTRLNIHQLIAALALLPDPIREDQGNLVLPLRNKGYVISAITFLAEYPDDQRAICIPQRLRILHDNNEIDLVDRLTRIGALVAREDLPMPIQDLANRYHQLVSGNVPVLELRRVSNGLAAHLEDHIELAEAIETPSEGFIERPEELAEIQILTNLTANEARRRLVSHNRIDRSRSIRIAKVRIFEREHGRIFCENCTFDFEKMYGERGRGFIEVHHLLPLAALLPNTITNLSNLMLLCSNCHRMVH
ncbi:MAG: HNH endonuclease [Syntrophobacteraceae bacterium]